MNPLTYIKKIYFGIVGEDDFMLRSWWPIAVAILVTIWLFWNVILYIIVAVLAGMVAVVLVDWIRFNGDKPSWWPFTSGDKDA